MLTLAAADDGSTTRWVVFACLAVVGLIAWGFRKYSESKAEKRSEDLRNLYASVHSERPKV